MHDWLFQTLDRLELPAAKCNSWKEFERRDADFAEAARVFLNASGVAYPKVFRPLARSSNVCCCEDRKRLPIYRPMFWRQFLIVMVRQWLRRSAHVDDIRLCDQAVDRLRLLGTQITETGSQGCVSPVTRILGYTHNKVKALIPILECELENMDDHLQAVVITDSEKASAVSTDVSHILNEEAGVPLPRFAN